MAIETSYSNARTKFASLCDTVSENREVVIIHRRGAEDVALISAQELKSLIETTHLLRSPKNVQRLLNALERAQKRTVKPQSIEALRCEVGVDEIK